MIRAKNPKREFTLFSWASIGCLAIAVALLPFFVVAAIPFAVRAFLVSLDPRIKGEDYVIRQRVLMIAVFIISCALLFVGKS